MENQLREGVWKETYVLLQVGISRLKCGLLTEKTYIHTEYLQDLIKVKQCEELVITLTHIP
jgi:hypothetical protein